MGKKNWQRVNNGKNGQSFFLIIICGLRIVFVFSDLNLARIFYRHINAPPKDGLKRAYKGPNLDNTSFYDSNITNSES